MAEEQGPPGLTGTVGQEVAALTVQKAWDNLMQRIGFYRVDLVKYGHTNLDRIDAVTGMKSRKLPL